MFVDSSHGPRCLFQPKWGPGSHALVWSFLITTTEGGKGTIGGNTLSNDRHEISDHQDQG